MRYICAIIIVAASCGMAAGEKAAVTQAQSAAKPIDNFYSLTREADLIVIGTVIDKTDNNYWMAYRVQVGAVLASSPLQRRVMRNEDISVLMETGRADAFMSRGSLHDNEPVYANLYKGGVYVLWLKKIMPKRIGGKELGVSPDTCFSVAATKRGYANSYAIGVIPLSQTRDLPESELRPNIRGGLIRQSSDFMKEIRDEGLKNMGLPENANVVMQVKGLVASNEQMLLADDEFALNVMKKLSAGAVDKNIAVSSMSIRAAMTLAWAGAAGKTAQEMEAALLIKQPDLFAAKYGEFLSANVLPGVSIANSVWTADALLADYSKICTADFHAGVFQADFEKAPEKQRKRINEWISGKTNNMIPELLGTNDIDRDTRLVLVNAIYFKELWLNKFDAHATHKQDFYVDDAKVVKADMMGMTERLPYYEDENVMAVRLEYKQPGQSGDDGRYDRSLNRLASMIAIMPKNSNPQKLDEFIAGLTAEKFGKISQKLQTPPCNEIVLRFPKFKLDSRYELKKLFEQLGVKMAFTGDADFSKMTGEKNLSITKIIHQAVIDLNETGTEAAAATAVVMTRECVRIERPKLIEFNRPFVFFIRNDKTGAIIFSGKVVDPTAK